MQGAIDLVHINPLLKHLIAVNVDKYLRYRGQEGRGRPGDLRPFLRFRQELLGVRPQKVDVLSGAVLQDESHPAGGADARYGRRRERERYSLWDAAHAPVEARHDGPVFLLRALALVPGFERDEEKPAVGVRHPGEHAVADHRGAVLHTGDLHDDLFELPGGGIRSLQRGGIRQLHAGVEIALVLLRQKAARHSLAQYADRTAHDDEQEQADDELADEPAADAHVAVGGLAEQGVEPAVEGAQGAAGLLLGLQDQGGKRRAEGQRVEGRDNNRDGDGDCKLLVELTRDTGDEDRRQEYRREHERDRHHRPGNLFHGF